MTISRTTSLSKLSEDGRLSKAALSYIRMRNRQKAYDLLVRSFKRSGLTQAELAKRVGKRPDSISRLFRRPSNIEIDTLSGLVFAMTGGALTFSIEYPDGRQTVEAAESNHKPSAGGSRAA